MNVLEGLEGQVALVSGGGDAVGRAVALALAARKMRIIVTGPVEKALGETVGEIAYQGGKARHVVADPTNAADLERAAARAAEVFGGLDVVIATDADAIAVECTLRTLAPHLRDPSRLVAASIAGAGASGAIACDVVDPTGHEPESVADEVVRHLAAR